MSDAFTSTSGSMSRRAVLAGGGAALAAVLTPALPAKAGIAGNAGKTTVASGTDFAVAPSPDGRLLALDLLGVLWVCSASGGTARRLTSDLYDIAQPDWSPDGRAIVFQSYRDGVFNLWTIRPDGSAIRQLTTGPFDHREPRYSPDGRTIAYSSDAGGSYGIHLLDVATGATRVLTDTSAEEYEPAWSPDGSKIAFVVADTRIDVVEVATGTRSNAVTVPTGQVIHQPSWLPNGTDLAYHLFHSGANDLAGTAGTLVSGEEVFPFRARFAPDGRYFYTSAGTIKVRRLNSASVGTIGFTAALTATTPKYKKKVRVFDEPGSFPVVGIGSPAVSPDESAIAFRALNDIYLMRIGGTPEPLFRDRWWKADPDFSPDGRQLAFVTDRTGTLNIWVRDLSTGADRQLTRLSGSAALSVRWSPDGREIAYLDQDGALWVVDVSTGDIQKIFDATFEPGRPTWSPDGRTLALAAVVPYSRRYREGLSKILLVDRATGAGTYIDPAPHRSLQTRGDDGPVWSPDGTMLAFAMESLLWVLPVDRTGRPTGSARQVTHEVSDSPVWAGGSATLLYLNEGRLKSVCLDGKPARSIPMRLTWRNDPGPDQVVIHAGRMWDGVSDRVVRDVDIIVRGQRITAIEPHREGRPGARIDARDRFVMPGLIDIHHHREMQGYAYGSRQGPLWLALGVTTTRSPGSPAYHMVEERESVQSGARLAPRYLGTGEAIDGPRIYYNFMRPTYSHDQLRLELRRAAALDYDMMKCYVRLPVAWHKEVIDWAHRQGKPVSSHYHYPAIAMGGDQTEHIGATNRFGYSRTVTNVGSAYSDVISMFNASKMARTPTLFNSSTLYRDDTSLVTDERVRRLYPNWRMAALQATVTAAQTADPTAVRVIRTNLANQVAQIAAMIRGGGVVTVGTDAPIDHLGLSLHMNLRAMVKYGLTPRETLTAATSTSATYLGLPLGRIAKGMYADLAIIDGDPLSRIEDAANVTAVVVGGRHHTVEQLLAPYPSSSTTNQATPAASAPSGKVKDRVPVHPSAASHWWNDPTELEGARVACCHDGC
ncbi:amidohydrolase family protein [Nonomuraea jiangxiensis]|uniref:WD40-like Beta Propeller Repeat n=1 Tax=Nonomuraea jiangxiensis TaxID=633440 RepID=A0A1G8PWV5_9ACTN|nr:amidohydrolase family protein [Nonomuraea jiangxiensis]SDI96984.1 WD40-like Beta Propeller Repeat [Nonomuraea jiangxiensis]